MLADLYEQRRRLKAELSDVEQELRFGVKWWQTPLKWFRLYVRTGDLEVRIHVLNIKLNEPSEMLDDVGNGV